MRFAVFMVELPVRVECRPVSASISFSVVEKPDSLARRLPSGPSSLAVLVVEAGDF